MARDGCHYNIITLLGDWKMKIKGSDCMYEVYLVDDGTMDTVLSVSPNNDDLFARYGKREIRFDCEYASEFRDDTGAMTDDGFEILAKEAVESYEQELED